MCFAYLKIIFFRTQSSSLKHSFSTFSLPHLSVLASFLNGIGVAGGKTAELKMPLLLPDCLFLEHTASRPSKNEILYKLINEKLIRLFHTVLLTLKFQDPSLPIYFYLL